MEPRLGRQLANCLLLAALAVCASGCATGSVPWIDPSGRHLFAPAPVRPAPVPTARPHDWHEYCVKLSPGRLVAPVDTEIVALAAVCGPEGCMMSNRRVDWIIEPGGVGHFVDVGKRTPLDWFCSLVTRPRKIDNTYAIGTTSSRYLVLHRATANYGDDVNVNRGQAWITLSSPIEGQSHVTAFAPAVYGWEARRQTMVVEWVDAAWTLPPPAVNPAGTQHLLTTTVTRHKSPVAVPGWRVQYRILDGPAAGFAPDGATAVEVLTDGYGQASVELFQDAPSPGINNIEVQIIRPAELSPNGQPLVVFTGSTTKTWTLTQISVTVSGPREATVGSLLTYRIDVVNPAGSLARDVIVSNQPPAGLALVEAVPPPTSAGPAQEWRIGDLQPGETRSIELSFRADRAGAFTDCASVRTLEGVTGQNCATTTVIDEPTTQPPVVPPVRPQPQPEPQPASSGLQVQVEGPSQAQVGDNVAFHVTVTNNGTQRESNLVLVDRFDAGLQHATLPSPIERALDDLAPGQSRRVTVNLQVTQPGQWCNQAEIFRGEAQLATGRACVDAVEAGAASPAAVPTIVVTKTGPEQRQVGEQAEFIIDIRNDSDVRATNLKIVDNYDLSLDPVQATDGFALAGADLVWRVDELPPGKTIRFQVICNCLAPARSACNRVIVTCDEGARDDAEACLAIGQAPSELSVSLRDSRDPITLGNDGFFEVTVKNNGQGPDSQIVLSVTLPPEMTPLRVNTRGPVGSTPQIAGQTITFQPVAELAPGATLTYQVAFRANAAGAVVTQAEVSSALQPTPQAAEERTSIVGQ